MTVTGATTARVGQGYVPPFKYVSSFGPAPQVTGTVTGTATTGLSNPTSTSPPNTSQVAAAGDAWAYLQSHMMSWPSYRYSYLMWIAFAIIALIYAAAHHLRLSRGSTGAGYARWGMRRTTIGSKKPGARNRSLPSNSVIVAIALIGAIAIVLSIIGSDYIAPSSSVLDFSTSFRKRDTNPTNTIGKAFWTSGSRLGDMAFALMPLVVLCALKSPPVALLSFRALTHLWSDKLAVFHRATAWLIWVFTTAHVVLWTIQLFRDQINGRTAWMVMWGNYRFIFGCVAYGALTAIMVSSLRPVQKSRYEFFYIAHVVLVFLTIVCCALHHPVLWYWMAAAMGLWGLERALRFVRFARTNALFGKTRRVPVIAGRPYRDSTPDNAYGMQEIKRSGEFSGPYTDKTLPRRPEHDGTWTSGSQTPMDTPKMDFGERAVLSYYDEGSLQPLGSYDSRQIDPYGRDAPSKGGYFPVERARPLSGVSTAAESFTPPPVPVGHAQAQLLPSRTIRLTIRVARLFPWGPGQSVLLYLPELSKIQSHPFTITNIGETEIVLLVKARKGITRRLFDLVRTRSLAAVGVNGGTDKRLSLASMRGGEGGVQAPPVYVRAWVDGPMGSAPRIRWCDFSTVLIICGGSGISFGMSICDYVCRLMAQGRGSRCKTERVRLCWVVREYAEIAWVAGQVRRCQQMVSTIQLQIDIFVTNSSKVREDFAPPRPGFAGGGHERRGSTDSLASEMSQDVALEDDDPIDTHDLSTNYADVIDLTNYEDEEDVNDPAEQGLSDRLQKQGKVRRAKSRKAARGGVRNAKGPAQRRQHSVLAPYEDDHEYFGNSRASNHDQDSLHAPPHPIASANDSRRHSYRSVADSTYGRFDPFAGGAAGFPGPSPSPSIMFDDSQSMAGESVRNLMSRQSRTGSMVLLEDNSGDPTGDAALWIDESDHAAMNVLSEMARAGKPKLSAILDEEIQQAKGSMIVATCGPVTLNTVVRNLVSTNISPGRIRHGDRRGHIAIYSEDYEA